MAALGMLGQQEPSVDALVVKVLQEQLGLARDMPAARTIELGLEQLGLSKEVNGLPLAQQANACMAALGVEVPPSAAVSSSSSKPAKETAQPEYWEKALAANSADGLAAIPLDRHGGDQHTWAVLERLLRTENAKHTLRLACAWRLENLALWEYYLKRDMQIIRNAGVAAAGGAPPATAQIANALPGGLNADVNEAILMHGSVAEVVNANMVQGMNGRFSGSACASAFGEGIYFAEDAAKCDQYVKVDARHDPSSELHKRLYSGKCPHPGDVFYIFVCRVARGHHVRTNQAGKDATSVDTGKKVFASDGKVTRELAKVPGVSSPVYHHSLVAEA